ncbi:MAG: hypothetical protein AAGH87_08960 [Pseudomonadota bacterium]
MPAAIASLVNALTLIAMPIWAYTTSETPSATALIPAGFGIALLACLPGVRAQNKLIAHIAAVLTLIVLLALTMPLRSAISGNDGAAMLRVGLMMATTAVAMVFFVKSFIDARKRRAEAS